MARKRYLSAAARLDTFSFQHGHCPTYPIQDHRPETPPSFDTGGLRPCGVGSSSIVALAGPASQN